MKKWVYNIINSSIDRLERLRSHFFKVKSENRLNLSHLNRLGKGVTLSENKQKEIQTHIDALYWGINEPEVYNIALSGSFGTGKSTIIHQLIKEKNINNHRTISLGEFGENELSPSSKERIEYSVLEQLLFSAKTRDLPDSKIERISNSKYVIWKVFGVILFLYATVFLFFPSINERIPRFHISNQEWHNWLWFGIFIIGLARILYKIYRSILDFTVSKVSLSDIELSNKNVFKNGSAPLLNQYYDEIHYFFLKSETRVLFIEDLDRFEHSRFIFNKLREINTLLNNSDEFKNDKITFVYAIKNNFIGDSIQTNKFFELVIPVLPFISFQTSKEIFFQELEEFPPFMNQDDKNNLPKNIEYLIVLISPFIFDVRTIYSVVNDFKITWENFNIQGKEFKIEELLAFSVYKTILNDDYDKLLNREGILFNLFNHKYLIQQKRLETYKDEFDTLKEKLKKSETETLNSTEELRKIFIFELTKSLSQNEIIAYIQPLDLLNEDKFEEYYEKEISIRNQYRVIKGLKSFEEQLGFNYYRRKETIQNKNEQQKEFLNRKITQNRERITDLKSKSLQVLLDRKFSNFWEAVNITSNLEIEMEQDNNPKDIKHKILSLLILEGYINERYTNYLSYSHKNYFDSDTGRYYEIIINNNPPEIDFKIEQNQVERLINELRPMYFANPAVLNNDIALKVLQLDVENEKRELFINQFKDGSEDIAKLASNIIQEDLFADVRVVFLTNLIEKGYLLPLLENLKNYEAIGPININLLKLYTSVRRHMSEEKLRDLNNYLNGVIQEDNKQIRYVFPENFDLIPQANVDEILSSVVIDKIENTTSIEDNLQAKYIFRNKLFSLNENNFLNAFNLYEVNSGNFNIKSIFDLYEHFKDEGWKDDEFEEDFTFILEIISKSKMKIEEEGEDAINIVLNKKNLEVENIVENIKAYIEKVDFKIEDISSVEKNELWDTLFKEERICPKWDNIKHFYRNMGSLDNNSIIDFIDTYSEELNSNSFDFTSEENAMFLKTILKADGIQNKKIFDASNICLNDVDFIKDEEELLRYFISLDFIEINRENFNVLSDDNKIEVINKHFGGDFDRTKSFLEFLSFTFRDIKDLFHLITNKQAQINIAEYLIQNRLNEIDFCYKEEFTKSFIQLLSLINQEFLSVDLFRYLSGSTFLTHSKKLEMGRLFINRDDRTFNEIAEILRALGYGNLVDGERIYIQNEEPENSFFYFLNNIDFINKPREIEKNSRLSIKRAL